MGSERNSESDIERRRLEVEAIRGSRDESCIPGLLKAMEDASWRVRKSAVDILLDDYPVSTYIDGLIRLLYIEDNAGARNSSIEALIRLGRGATPFLIEAFKTDNRDVRKFIIDVLGEQNDHRTLPLMLDAIKDEDENVRATAVEHLGKTREASAVDALIEILDGGDLWMAYPAADALGRIGNTKALPHLLKALQRKPLREPILQSLGCFADPSTLEHVVPLFSDPSRNIQEKALRTVEKFYHNGVEAGLIVGALKRLLGEQALEVLIKHAWSSKREVRMSAILLLGLMKDEAAYGPLLDISQEEEFAEDVKNAFVFIGRDRPESLLQLFDTDNPHQRRFICEVTEKIASPVYYDVLARMLNNEDGHVRSIAALSISRLGDRRAVGMIIKLLSDPYEDVQEAAVEALSNLRNFVSVEEIIALLREGSPVIKKNAARLLGKIGAAVSVSALGFALKDGDVKVRRAVVEAFYLIGSEDAARYLSYALTDEDPSIRTAAALSLGSIGGQGVVDSLTILVADPDATVRVSAAKALGMMADKTALDTLIGLLSDESGFVVTAAIESLAKMGGTEAVDAVVGMLSHKDEEIRRTAIMAMGSFEDVEKHLLGFLKDRDWATRMSAVRVLGRRPSEAVRSELERLLDSEEDPTVAKTIEDILRVR